MSTPNIGAKKGQGAMMPPDGISQAPFWETEVSLNRGYRWRSMALAAQ
jgi:hypothetical protein